SYSGYKVKHVCIVELRGKMTYQVRIYKKGGLFGRKQKTPNNSTSRQTANLSTLSVCKSVI
ncbi:MAG: hypothetical protein J6W45_07760, partial [Bacteroidales bacterium]|nr:hypothetical protein [Bacteroidales bacterium]